MRRGPAPAFKPGSALAPAGFFLGAAPGAIARVPFVADMFAAFAVARMGLIKALATKLLYRRE